ncbi:hypothetical protein BMS3Bbin11_00247 [bacterium BMS3Bbin11]|nr:hypothetical protein BMS3Abin11_02099 [bacterium BMS3Abin11]GBE45167.1 hypothetical protein BMS3Bbin11_00247 [bacterium BMS3Bbin11]
MFLISLLRNILALIGLAAVVAAGMMYPQIKKFQTEFDPGAFNAYKELVKNVLETGSAVDATTWKYKLEDGVSIDDAIQSMKIAANAHNIKHVGELPLYKEVEAMTGKPYRHAQIFMFCNAVTAAKMMDYNDAYSAYLPCRVALVEDKQGQAWLYSLNMDLMIYGGKPLPPELKEEAINVKKIILDIMQKGAAGDF